MLLQGKGIKENRIAEMVFKMALLASAVSLLVYIPYKYATQLHALKGLYGFLFPLSSLIALTGIAAVLHPKRVFQLPSFVRAGIGSVAILWMATGLVCIPSLIEWTLTSPLFGLLATFQMAAQHLFLSLSVVAFAVAPHVPGWLGNKVLSFVPKSLA